VSDERSILRRTLESAEVWLAFGVITIIALLVIPLPPGALDVLLALSISLSLVVLLVTLFTSDPLHFSVFPSLLLLLTLFRLGLNVSATRLILGEGHAGRVIAAFGNAVIGGNYVVGLVIFLILVVINFMVITKGAGRIAEVAARFTLDAMPGRQMSIDADLGAGLIDESEARRRREEISHYADFYGSMDGAAKFVRGDAVAGLVITAINLLGGFVVGMAQRGLSLQQALTTYSSLTVGDGLVTQIPALIVSTSAGIIVTYGSSAGQQVAPAMLSQVSRYPKALWIASGILATIAIVPGFPALPFLVMSGAIAGGAALSATSQQKQALALVTPAAPAVAQAAASIHDLLAVDALELEVGYALVPLVDEAQQGDLLQRIALVRKQVAVELGIVVPPIRIRDNIQLPSTEYRIRVRGAQVARGEVMPRYLMALNTTGGAEPIEGIPTTDPSFGIPAVWIAPERRSEAEAGGYRVVEPQTVLATHLMEAVKHQAGDLLGRQETKELLDSVKQHNAALVEEVVPGRLSLGAVHRVLQRLLREGIPIRDMVTILETLSDASEQSKDVEALTEQVRRALSKVIARLHQDADGTVRGITMGPRLEASLLTLFSPRSPRAGIEALAPDDLTGVLTSLHDAIRIHQRESGPPPLITSPALRVGVRRLVEPVMPLLSVLSLGELPPEVPVQSLAVWEIASAA
jgi:flagellar biosynthesis protein FlhA